MAEQYEVDRFERDYKKSPMYRGDDCDIPALKFMAAQERDSLPEWYLQKLADRVTLDQYDALKAKEELMPLSYYDSLPPVQPPTQEEIDRHMAEIEALNPLVDPLAPTEINPSKGDVEIHE